MSKEVLPGLYVHVPFCKTKCPYCDFYSITDLSLVHRWLDALRQEVHLYKDTFPLFDTLYIGGGTPSVLGEEMTGRLLGILRDGFSFAPDTETTIEVNPDDVTPSLLACYAGLGINRLSLGVQSLHDNELLFLQRRHTAAGAGEAIGHTRASGFSNFGIDLMYGLPGQSMVTWQKTLERVLAWDTPHLSCYQLTVAGGTPFGQMAANGRLVGINEEQERDFFLFTSRFLQKHGFIHYEISNFAREERYYSRHNLKYWRRGPYLGLGPGAHSFRDNRRWWNLKSVTGYFASLEKGDTPVEGRENLTDEQALLERLMLGLRTREGIGIGEAGQGVSLETLNRLQSAGIIVMDGKQIRPTLEGYLMADRLPLMVSDS